MTEDLVGRGGQDDALEALLAHAAAAVPGDAASRILERLPPAAVEDALFWGEADRLARRVLRASALLALLGLLALAVVLVHTPAGAPRPDPEASAPAGAAETFPEVAPRSLSDVAHLLVSAERDAARSGSPRFFEGR